MAHETVHSPQDVRYVRQLLDEALRQLTRIEDPVCDLPKAHRHIGRAIQNTYEAARAHGDQSAYARLVKSIADNCREVLTGLQASGTEDLGAARALGFVAESLRLTRELRPIITTESPEIPPADGAARASAARPTLQRPTRAAVPAALALVPNDEALGPAPLSASVPALAQSMEEVQQLIANALAEQEAHDAATEAPAVASEKADEDEAPAGPSPDEVLFGDAREPGEQLRAQALEIYRDLGMMGRMRMPEPTHSWLHGDETERRLMARVDALVACGTWIVPEMVATLADSPIPDPLGLWALIFFLGSLDGQDSIDQMFRIVNNAPLDDEYMADEVQRFIANALSLAPHPGITKRLRPWLEDYRLARRRVATEALSQKRALTLTELYELVQDEDEHIASLAARGIGSLPARVARGTMNRPLLDERPAVVRACISAGLRHLDTAAFQRALEILGGDDASEANAARFIAISASEAQGQAAFTPLSMPLTRIDIADALGWFGDLRYVGPLIDALESEEPGLPMAAVGALERLTGSRMTADDADPIYADDDLPFARDWAPPIVLPDPCMDADAWRAWWQKHGGRADTSRRHRYGHLWCLQDCLWALGDEITTIEEREFVHLEWVCRTGLDFALEPHLFALSQLGSLQVIRDATSRLDDSDYTGGWPSRLPR